MIEKTDKTQKLETKSIISFAVSPDKMSVTLILKKNHDKHIKITSADILSELDRMGIIFGIEHGVINGAVEFYNEYEDDDDVVIAQGIQPMHGTKGRLECLVVKKEVKIAVKDDGTIDFHNKNTITPVRQGQPVYRVIPPTMGKDGKDVYGHIVKSREYEHLKLPVIKNSEIDKSDPNLLISSINGSITFLKDNIRITKYHFVNGDIDYESGNIKYDGPVKVTGDVKSGFEIDANGNVEIDGIVEDALIKSKGDVVVKCGFVGTGKGKIACDGDVSVGYLRNQCISTKGSIFIDKEAIESTLTARGKIYVAGKGLGLIGGYSSAVEGMELSNLGSVSEVKTVIQVGSNPVMKKNIETLNSSISQLRNKNVLLDNQLKEIQESKKKSKNIFENMVEKMEKIMETRMNIDIKIRELLSKKSTIEKEDKICDNPIIRVYNSIFPGVVLSFHNFKKVIKDKMEKRMLYLDNCEIVESIIIGDK